MKSVIRGTVEGTVQKVKGTVNSCKEPAEKGLIALLHSENGKIGWILLWLLGIPIPVLLVLYFLRGCT